MVLSMFLSGEAHMATRLARNFVSESRQAPGEVLSRDITREPHTAITSSRTK